VGRDRGGCAFVSAESLGTISTSSKLTEYSYVGADTPLWSQTACRAPCASTILWCCSEPPPKQAHNSSQDRAEHSPGTPLQLVRAKQGALGANAARKGGKNLQKRRQRSQDIELLP